ncbi:hypothetical protein CRG98_038691 [Punica granatum]|uniref:G-patch domain-containing protein n=1 Tax=Punica granatum TaxID=22663 RepID=A0A2I0IC11_PUNGR|nr:hypothetical protein CRG98_038691 [Punica granatum]
MGVTRSGRVYENLEAVNKGKAPTVALGITPEAIPIPQKEVTEEEAEAFMKIIKASEYKVLAAAQVPKEMAPDLIEETVGSIFSNNISFSDDKLPSEGSLTSRMPSACCSGGRAFSLLLGRPWIHSAGAVPSTLHQKLKFIVEKRLITVKGEEDYAIYKETVVPYISIGDDHNLFFHSFDTISVIRNYGKVGPSHSDHMVGKVLLRHNFILGSELGAHGQGINRPIKIEEYKNRRGLGFRPSCHEIIEARRGKHLHRLATHYGRINRGIPVPPLSHFSPGPLHVVEGTLDGPSSDSDDAPVDLPAICVVTEETRSGVYICLAQENEELNNWISVPRYSPDGRVPEIEESLHCLENCQLTSVESTEEINVGTEEEPYTLKIETGLDPTQRARMIDFLKVYQEVFAWSYADMPGLDPSIVKHFLPLDT